MRKRLRVLFIPTNYPGETNPVAGIFVKEHARAASLYHDVVVLCAYRDPSPKLWKMCRITEGVEGGIRTVRVRYGGALASLLNVADGRGQARGSHIFRSGGHSTPLRRLLAILRKATHSFLYDWVIFLSCTKLVGEGWKPDIIHAHVFTAGVPAVVVGKRYGIPVVVTEHSSSFPLRKLTALDRMRARFAMNRAKMILPVSDDLQRHIESYGVRGTFTVVPNAVDSELFFPSPSSSQDRLNADKRLLLVAGLTPVKGVPYLLDALSRLGKERQDFVFDIVGDGPNRGEYEGLSRRLGLEKMVRFHGFKAKPEVAQLMRDCDFYVQPSLWENLPCAIIEVTACGKPVIASEVGGIREIIDRDNGILVSPKDVGALKDAIQYMLDNHQRYSPGEIAEHANGRFSFVVVGKALDRVYQEVLAR